MGFPIKLFDLEQGSRSQKIRTKGGRADRRKLGQEGVVMADRSRLIVRIALLQSTCSAALFLASPAAAQVSASAAAASDDTEIVVTARKQAESLISVPVSVTAVSRNELERTNANDLYKIIQFAPQVSVSSSQYGAAFVIRGIGSNPLDQGLDQTVSLYFDGIAGGRGLLGTLGMFDIQQVEILKGPQALFFGKNSPAGVISVTSAGPTNELSGYAKAGYEFIANERYVEAAVGGPITDTLGIRVAARGTKMDGWMINTAQPGPNPFSPFPLTGAWSHRVPNQRAILGRATITWKPVNNFDMTFKAFGTHYKDNFAGLYQASSCPDGVPVTAGVPDPLTECKFDNKVQANYLPQEIISKFPRGGDKPLTNFKARMLSLTANYQLDNVTLTSVTGHYKIDYDVVGASVDGNIGFIIPTTSEHTRFWSQELRAVSHFDFPVNFTIGGYFEDTKRGIAGEVLFHPPLFLGPDPVTGKWHSLESATDSTGKTYSLFGQLRWDIIDNVELAGGLRWTDEKKTVDAVTLYAHQVLAANFTPIGKHLKGTFKDDNISPEVTLTWHPNPDSTLYGAYKTGYKSGGFSSVVVMPVTYTTAGALEFGPEKAKGFEVGYKARLFNRALRFEVTAYHYDYNGLQLTSFDTATLSYNIRNAAKARTKGIEMSAEWRATPELSFRGDIAYGKARYRKFIGAACYAGQTPAQGCIVTNGVAAQDLSGRPLERAPDWSGAASFNYEQPIGSNLLFGLSGDATYSGSYYSMQALHPGSKQDSYWKLGGSVRISSQDKTWELALIGRNLTNKYTLLISTDRSNGLPGEVAAYTNRAREVTIQGTYRF
jgi:outer membrane receptor protein involved in Fe transport